MTDLSDNQKLHDLLKINRNKRKIINEKRKEIQNLEREIKLNKKLISKLCIHQWVKDPPMINERTTYTCSICHEDRNSCLYH
jgi:hypothetical protein